MCRLFALAAREPVSATFWLLDAPDSLEDQSRANPDGCGLGWYDAAGRARVERQPIAAYADRAFARSASTVTSDRFVGHVRFATAGANRTANTHPFEAHNMIFAHNGAVGGLAALDAELARSGAGPVRGDTDSERVFALIAQRIRAAGEARAGLRDALDWIAAHLPVYALNLVLATPQSLFALRWPAVHELFVLERHAAGGGGEGSEGGGGLGRHGLRSSLGTRIEAPASGPRTVVIASEPMDAEGAWRPLASGELLEVRADLTQRSDLVLPPAAPHPWAPDRPRGASR